MTRTFQFTKLCCKNDVRTLFTESMHDKQVVYNIMHNIVDITCWYEIWV